MTKGNKPRVAIGINANQSDRVTAQYISDLLPIDAPYYFASGVQLQAAGNELILSFTRTMPMRNKSGEAAHVAMVDVVAMIALSPHSAKDIMTLLADVIKNYESEFGEIVTPYLRERTAIHDQQK